MEVNIEQILATVESQLNMAEDELWLLQTDSQYFRQLISAIKDQHGLGTVK